MRTFEHGKQVVDIVVWPENKPWEGRYQTSSTIERGICQLVLSTPVFHDAEKANTAYKRFKKKMIRAGYEPPNVEFRNLNSKASQQIFCILTPQESIFNSACTVGKMYIIESGATVNKKVCAILLKDSSGYQEGDEFPLAVV